MKYKASIITSAAALIALTGLAGFGLRGETVYAVDESTQRVESTSESALRSKTYEVDPTHSGVFFKIRHRGVTNFYGRYNEIAGTIELDKLHMDRSSMNITVQTKSVDTGNRTRDGHIRGADFFNTRQYPEANFVSTSIEEKSDGVYTLSGDFTMHGKTVPITAELFDVATMNANGMDLMGFEARFSIKRSEFDITKHLDVKDPEGGSLGDTVELIVTVEGVAK